MGNILSFSSSSICREQLFPGTPLQLAPTSCCSYLVALQATLDMAKVGLLYLGI